MRWSLTSLGPEAADFNAWKARWAAGVKGTGRPAEYGGGGLSKEQAKIFLKRWPVPALSTRSAGWGMMSPHSFEYGLKNKNRNVHSRYLSQAKSGGMRVAWGGSIWLLQTFAEDKGDHLHC